MIVSFFFSLSLIRFIFEYLGCFHKINLYYNHKGVWHFIIYSYYFYSLFTQILSEDVLNLVEPKCLRRSSSGARLEHLSNTFLGSCISPENGKIATYRPLWSSTIEFRSSIVRGLQTTGYFPSVQTPD